MLWEVLYDNRKLGFIVCTERLEGFYYFQEKGKVHG